MTFSLTDDGTLDTVLRCADCGQELRYNFDGESGQTYDDFVEWALTDADEDHECEEDDDTSSD